MARLDDIYAIVGRVADPVVDAAMAAALPTADPRSRRAMVQMIVERGREEALVGMVGQFHRLDADLQQLIVDRAATLDRPLRLASRQDDMAAENVLRIVSRANDATLAYLAVSMLTAGSTNRRHAAARCLLDLVDWAMGITPVLNEAETKSDMRPPQRERTAVAVSHIRVAVSNAVNVFDHHQQSAVARAMLACLPLPLPWPGSPLPGTSNAPTGGAMPSAAKPSTTATTSLHRVLEAQLRDASDVRVRRAAIVLLGRSQLTAATERMLERLCAVGAWSDVLAHGHLLLLPRVMEAVARVSNGLSLGPQLDRLHRLEPAAARWMPTWIHALYLPPREQAEVLGAMTAYDDAAARLAALRRLMAQSTRGPNEVALEVVARFCDDTDPRIARIAFRHLARFRWSGLEKTLPRLINSDDTMLRDMATRLLAPLCFERLWTGWPRLDEEQRLSAGRALIKIDQHFHRHLGERLESRDEATRVRALVMIANLNQGRFFEQELIALTRDTSEKVASAAVTALGSAGSETAREALRATLEHADARVRANAVEALDRLKSSQHVQKLIAMAREDANRPRANAIKALLNMRVGDAIEALEHMLHDPKPEHRLSALWVVESMGILTVAHDVAELSVSDVSPRVQTKARSVTHQLIEQLRGATQQATGGRAAAVRRVEGALAS